MNIKIPFVSIIAAVDANNLIGNKNSLPWHIPGELARFKKITMGKPIIMGRKTHESIGKVLEGRINIVLSKDPSFKKEGIYVFNNLKDAIKKFENHEEIIIIGGENIFKLSIPIAQRIYITKIHEKFVGDTWFPKINNSDWEVTSKENHITEGNRIKYSYLIYRRTSE
ncbi:MAG: dihydrofolate reductase [Pseudomonadota bacterium]|nr:dihydrofolate reductase [Pseudomonadota bacterium]